MTPSLDQYSVGLKCRLIRIAESTLLETGVMISPMGKRHGIRFFAWTIVTIAAGAVIFAAQHPYDTTRSNLGSWVEGLGLIDLAPAIPESADRWATWGGAFVALVAASIAIPHLFAFLRGEDDVSILDGEWILHFNPKSGFSKPLTFQKDGLIGKGRNKNEWRWTISGDELAIWREDGSLQNKFKHLGSPDKFVFVADFTAKGIADQFIVRP